MTSSPLRVWEKGEEMEKRVREKKHKHDEDDEYEDKNEEEEDDDGGWETATETDEEEGAEEGGGRRGREYGVVYDGFVSDDEAELNLFYDLLPASTPQQQDGGSSLPNPSAAAFLAAQGARPSPSRRSTFPLFPLSPPPSSDPDLDAAILPRGGGAAIPPRRPRPTRSVAYPAQRHRFSADRQHHRTPHSDDDADDDMSDVEAEIRPKYVNIHLGQPPAGNRLSGRCSECRARLPMFLVIMHRARNHAFEAYCTKHKCPLASCSRPRVGRFCAYHTCASGRWCAGGASGDRGAFVGDDEHLWTGGNCVDCACMSEKGCPRVKSGAPNGLCVECGGGARKGPKTRPVRDLEEGEPSMAEDMAKITRQKKRDRAPRPPPSL